jgi:hypothetical protein
VEIPPGDLDPRRAGDPVALRSSPSPAKPWCNAQTRFTPPGLYTDLFEKYQPDLVIASTAGWRLDRYLLREAARGIPTMAAIVGWDNPSSYAIPGAPMDYATCWSELQKDELVDGSDWDPERVHIGGIPSYDGYFRKTWQMPKEDYFRCTASTENRKLISYACSFVHFAPNYPNVEALARLVSSDALAEPSQLLVRLHPSHFQDKPRIFAEERERIFALEEAISARSCCQPGGPGRLARLLRRRRHGRKILHDGAFGRFCDRLLHHGGRDRRPRHADCRRGDRHPRRLEQAEEVLALAQRDRNWPTHKRFREAKGGRVAQNEAELRAALNAYLKTPPSIPPNAANSSKTKSPLRMARPAKERRSLF